MTLTAAVAEQRPVSNLMIQAAASPEAPARGAHMATERQLEEAVARCVATMVLYHNEGRTRPSTLAMKAEVRATAAHVSGLGVTGAQAGERLVHPVEAELIARYGPEEGRGLYREFVRAYDGRPDLGPILSPAKT